MSRDILNPSPTMEALLTEIAYLEKSSELYREMIEAIDIPPPHVPAPTSILDTRIPPLVYVTREMVRLRQAHSALCKIFNYADPTTFQDHPDLERRVSAHLFR